MTRAQSSSSGPKPGLTKTAGIQPVRGAASRVPSETVHEDPEEEADSELERVREQEDEAEIEAIMREMLQNLVQQLLEERKREDTRGKTASHGRPWRARIIFLDESCFFQT